MRAAQEERITMRTFDDILADFELLDDWEDRYRYVIELGRELEPLPEGATNDENKVPGCVSQVWLLSRHDAASPPHLFFQGDSDAHIVRGLVAITLALYSGKTAPEILALDAETVFAELGLKEHLTPQRSNGLRSMVGRIRRDAQAALAEAA
jgi:cysteine desulfuration protein SufE